MGTLMQKKAAKITVEKVRTTNKISKGEILTEAGYSHAVTLQPEKVFGTEGFQEELENFGLTEDLIKTSLVEDIKGKPRKRFFELSLGAEILGLKKQGTMGNNTNVQINILNFGNNDTPPVPPEGVPAAGPSSN